MLTSRQKRNKTGKKKYSDYTLRSFIGYEPGAGMRKCDGGGFC